jgi:hypothetical protein
MIMMKARVGDRLIPDGNHGRVGVVIGVQNADGSPPYVVKWLRDGHIAMVVPGPYTRILPGNPPDGRTEPCRSTEPEGGAESAGSGALSPNPECDSSADYEGHAESPIGRGECSRWC